ncbi:MAG TPA: SEC-C metal-binding domain-containing protein [Candidatus Brocadiia bacterium]|nr:SEC-C metal-binding domain-containing protein [Candidatus Brocadiia bacterium]
MPDGHPPGADRAAFRDLFVSRAVEAWRGRGREAVAAAAVENVLRLMCDEETPFCLWDFSAVSRWARKRGLAVEADDLRQRFVEALREALCQAARKSLAHAAPEEVFDRLVTCGMDAFAPLSSVGSEDWNFRVLQEWGDALGLRIPVSQWQKTDMEDEAPEGKAGAEPPAEVDQDKAKRDEIRKWLAERLPRAAGSRPPVDLVCDMLRHELNRLLGVMEAEKASNYRTIVTALDSAFDLGVSDGELQAIVRTQRQRMAKDLAGLWLQATAQEPEEKLAPAAFEDMLAVFLDYDLARPGRNFAELSEMMRRRFEIEIDPFDLSHYALQDLPDRLMEQVREKYARRRAEMTPELMNQLERYLLLQKIDSKWKDHLYNMDHLKGGIGMRAYAQVDPKVEYTREARRMFMEMMASIREDVADLILRVRIEREERAPSGGQMWQGAQTERPASQAVAALADDGTRAQQEAAMASGQQGEKPRPVRKTAQAVGRNDPCPCGSGKKYKKCCGAQAQ